MSKLPQHIQSKIKEFVESCEDWVDDGHGDEFAVCTVDEDKLSELIATILDKETKKAVDGVLEKMKPYTITGNRDMYCATFTIEQFKQILNYKSNKRR